MINTRQGHLVVVVGPSGAGKDSLLNAAKTHFENNPRIEFVRRIITRECDPSSEIHDTLSEDQFISEQKNGAFSVWWQANGLYYGLPASVQTQIAQGQLLIANGSRAALPNIRSSFSALTIINITVDTSELASRLARRSRESQEQIEQRLQRNQSLKPVTGDDVVSIDNSGARETAIEQFIDVLDSIYPKK